MDLFEVLYILISRIRELEPEDVAKKIIGYLLLRDCDSQMIQLAMAPDTVIQNLVRGIKVQLGLASVSPPISPSTNQPPISNLPFSGITPTWCPPALSVPNARWDPQFNSENQPAHNSCFIPYQTRFRGLNVGLEQVNPGIPASSSYYHQDPILSELPVKVCRYFNKGFCKHGTNCRYFHGEAGEAPPDISSLLFHPNSNEFANVDQYFAPWSLERMELEIAEILKLGRGKPIPIALLPRLYYDNYGRLLPAEGYLLTKLLALLNNSFQLVDRAHGEYSVILAEDAKKYMENQSERNNCIPIISGAQQIYLTFPAESSFKEEDVSNYFSSFGPVQDVRIPCHQRRMFGFVTFASADTVKKILSKGNPHYVCGARVLVKPYKEKSKILDRISKRLEPLMNYNSGSTGMDSKLDSRLKPSKLPRKKVSMDEQEFFLEFQSRRFSELQLAHKPSADELKASEAQSEFMPAEYFDFLLNDNPNDTGASNTNQESEELDLPTGQFPSPILDSISSVIEEESQN
ncbi:zinc finger CCCH domain-containing protein 18-like isoform X2 [Diospyros lotus]|uniref:zinc finger CCCH domain-containing protein 18-like isoform X2 n=1 Tax=Diospyros lotus TaxID=55363 RepID=UPI002258008B|nr:zinc finger CCCH domain-containing protein 18-like isoform X2 [Diospyros lotus]